MAVNSSYGRLISSSLPICLNNMVTIYCLFCKVLNCGWRKKQLIIIILK